MAQLYRLRSSENYCENNTSYQPTRPGAIPIGERRKPRPEGRPGFLVSTPSIRAIGQPA
jgi:hypothetical protein